MKTHVEKFSETFHWKDLMEKHVFNFFPELEGGVFFLVFVKNIH